MENKKCFKCGNILPLDCFYKHNQMKDGHLNKCIDCAKKDVTKKYFENIKIKEYVEKERIRCREKYKRLGYVNSNKKEYLNKHILKSCHRFIKCRGYEIKNKELHHWNYLYPHSMFILSRRQHKLIHKNITYSQELNCFITKDNILLDTKEKHNLYIIDTLNKSDLNKDFIFIDI